MRPCRRTAAPRGRFSHTKLPWRVPGGAWALLLGSAAAWLLAAVGQPGPVSAARLGAAVQTVGIHWPVPVVGDLVAGLTHPLLRQYLVPVVLPMGLFNVLGSLQNIESAEAAGDSYPTLPPAPSTTSAGPPAGAGRSATCCARCSFSSSGAGARCWRSDDEAPARLAVSPIRSIRWLDFRSS